MSLYISVESTKHRPIRAKTEWVNLVVVNKNDWILNQPWSTMLMETQRSLQVN